MINYTLIKLKYLLMSLLLGFLLHRQGDCSLNERQLLQDLLAHYDPLERPVYNETDTLMVTLGITYQQIIKLSWIDVNLTWNSSNYGGLTSLRIPSSKIWKPDLLLYNSADPRFDSTYPTNVVVQSNGSTFYMPPGVFTSTCKIDITWFPFDDQLCKLKFGSWSYDMSQVDLDVIGTQGDLSTYIENGEWILLAIPGRRNKVLYRCCADPFSDVTYTIHIRRRTLYYGINLIIPCLIISSMTLLGFTLPPDSGEKLTLGVTILLSMTVFLLQLTETLPATSDTVSAIATYFASIMLMVAFSVVMTVVVLNFHYKSSDAHELNPLMKKIILQWLAFILNVKRPGAVKPPERSSSSNRSTSKVYTINRDELPFVTTSLSSPPSPHHYNHNYTHCNHHQHHPHSSSYNTCAVASHHQHHHHHQPAHTHPSLTPHPPFTGLSSYNTFSSSHPYDHHPANNNEIHCCTTATNNSSLPNLLHTHHQVICVSCRKSFTPNVTYSDEDDQMRDTHDRHHHHGKQMNPSPPPPSFCPHCQEDPQRINYPSSHSACHGKQLEDILSEIQYMTNRIRKEDQVIEILDDWKFAAIVIDRLCFVMFSTFSIISSSICFMSAPHLIV